MLYSPLCVTCMIVVSRYSMHSVHCTLYIVSTQIFVIFFFCISRTERQNIFVKEEKKCEHISRGIGTVTRPVAPTFWWRLQVHLYSFLDDFIFICWSLFFYHYYYYILYGVGVALFILELYVKRFLFTFRELTGSFRATYSYP